MQRFQKKLFVILAAALCGTCVYQWHLQENQSVVIDRQNQDLFRNARDIQDYTNSIKIRDDQIAQLQERIGQLIGSLTTNDTQLLSQKREMARLQSAAEILEAEIAQYKTAVAGLENKIGKAYEGEKKLAAQRDEYVTKLNGSIKAQNEITGKYNELVDRFNKLQAQPAPAK